MAVFLPYDDRLIEMSDLKPIKKIPADSLPLMFAGDIVMSKCPNKEWGGLFKRYGFILEHLANEDKTTRSIKYKIITALALGSHARHIEDTAEKKRMYDLKNDLFFSLANNKELESEFKIKYLVTNRFLVTKFCDQCEKNNSGKIAERWKWKHCKNCEVDRNFFNIYALNYRAKGFAACLFASNDQKDRFEKANFKKDKLDKYAEEILIGNYTYNSKNLNAFELKGLLELNSKLAES